MRLPASAAVVVVALAMSPAGAHPASAAPPASLDVVARAMASAVEARMGRGVSVSIGEVFGLRMTTTAPSLVAVPDPQARVGAPVRFLLAEGARGRRRGRVGEATATVHVSGQAVTARRAIARGTRLTADDVAAEDVDLSGRPFRPLPTLDTVLGGRASHDIAEGAIVAHADFLAEPAVRSGDLVNAHVRIGEVEIVGSAVAAESGEKGEIIRVVNDESRAVFRARVIGNGEVEVVHVR